MPNTSELVDETVHSYNFTISRTSYSTLSALTFNDCQQNRIIFVCYLISVVDMVSGFSRNCGSALTVHSSIPPDALSLCLRLDPKAHQNCPYFNRSHFLFGVDVEQNILH